MTTPRSNTDATPGTAKSAVSVRLILLPLVAIICLGAGVLAGQFLQGKAFPAKVDSPAEHPTASDPAQHVLGGTDGQAHPAPSSEAVEKPHGQAISEERIRQRISNPHDLSQAESADGHGEPVDPAVVSSASPPLADPTTSPTASEQILPEQILIDADRFFEAGDYRAARDRYQPLLTDSTGAIDVLLLFKFALCEESLGNRKGALAGYRDVLELTPEPAIRNAALQGQARIWSATGRTELATSALFRVLFEEATPLERTQILHHLASLLARRVEPFEPNLRHSEKLFQDQMLVPPDLIVRPAAILAAMAPMKTQRAGPHVPLRQELIIVRQTGTSPDGVVVSLQYERTSALTILDRTLKGTGFTARMNAETQGVLSAHSIEPECLEIPLSVALDCLLEPLELIWEFKDSTIQILSAGSAEAGQLAIYRQQAAQRMLKLASTEAPDHLDAPASLLELARISVLSQPRATGIQLIEQMVSKYPRSDYVSIAWFNLGKLLILEGRPADATRAFYRAADMLTGESLEIACYLYVGRIGIENDDPRSAIGPLTRGLSLSMGTPFEGVATLQLSAAYLMLNHFQRANNLLVEHLAVLQTQDVRDQAAFLTGLIHYRWTNDPHDQFRAGTTLLATTTNISAERCFGGIWSWLIGGALRDLGMTQAAVQVFCRCLETSYPFPLQNRIRSLLLLDAPEQLSRLPSGKRAVADLQAPESFQLESTLVEAEALFRQGRFDDVQRTCREILRRQNVSDAQRRQALRVMGRALQAQGRYEESVQCFSGTIPKDIPPEPGPSALLERRFR